MDSSAARDLLRSHFLAERARDLDATMATLCAHPSWLLPTYRVEGREAGRAMYAKSLPGLPEGWSDECIRALDDPQVTSWGETHCVMEYTDSYALHRGWVAVIHFGDDGIRSENVYPPPGTILPADLGADFETLPGVTRT